MRKNYGSRVLLGVSCVLAILLLALAVIQYRWAGRLAEADAEHTTAQLRSAAGLFARDFDLRLAQVYVALQNQAAVPDDHGIPHTALTGSPLIQEVYLLIPSEKGTQVLEDTGSGKWAPLDSQSPTALRILKETAPESGTESPACDSRVLDNAAAMLIPLATTQSTVVLRLPRVDQFFRQRATVPGNCLYAALNRDYLRRSLFPALIRSHFGDDATAKYDFRVVSRKDHSRVFFHTGAEPRSASATPAIAEPVFAMRLEDMLHNKIAGQAARIPHLEGTRLFIHAIRTQTIRDVIQPGSSLAQIGAWQLEVSPRLGPLPGWLNLWRQQNLLLSLAVELLLLASIGFLLISTRRVQRLAGQKMQFVAGVSHELRNPLAAIGMLSRNQADGLVRTPEQVRQYGSLMREQVERLTEMVEKTLQYAGIQSGLRTRDLAEVHAGRVIEDALASRGIELDRAGFDVEVNIQPDLPAVAGDAQSLKQAVENLLSNAVKYAEDGHWISVTAASADGGETVCITVQDRGAGVDPAEVDQIFEPFYRGRRAVDAQIPGSGLGLSLVRSTVEAHKGAVVFARVPDSGASFTIKLPAAQSNR